MTRQARILQVSSYPPPMSGWSVRILFLRKRLEDTGHVCRVLNIGPSRAVPSPEYDCVLGPGDFVRKLWRFSREGFRVHAHTNGHSPKGLLLALVALLINAAWGRRPVLTFHGGAEQTYFPRSRTPLWMIPPFKVAFAAAHRIVCNNDVVRRGLAEYGVDSTKIAPIPAFSTEYLAFDPVDLPKEVETFLQRWPEIVFTYVRLRSIFYVDTLLDAFAELARARPGVGLVVCGVGEHAEGDVAATFKRRVQSEPFATRLLSLPDLERTKFLTALARAKVCVRTPTTDGVSSSVLEALALRVPVVASENGHRPSGVFTYPPTDAGALAAGIARVLDDHERVVRELPRIEAQDTLSREVDLLVSP